MAKPEKKYRVLGDLATKLEPVAGLEVSQADFVRAPLAAHDMAMRSLQAMVEMPADISSRFASPIARQQQSFCLVRLPFTPNLRVSCAPLVHTC